MDRKGSRRQFLKTAAVGGTAFAAYAFFGCEGRRALGEQAIRPGVLEYMTARDRTVARAALQTPAENVRAAIDGLGGIGKFVGSGDVVVVKPNIGWNKPPELTFVASATEKASEITGAEFPTRPPRDLELRHDIHVTQIFLTLCLAAPVAEAKWRHEDELVAQGEARNGQRIPDAIVETDPPQAVDFGGSYSAKKIAAIHAHYAAQRVAYSIW